MADETIDIPLYIHAIQRVTPQLVYPIRLELGHTPKAGLTPPMWDKLVNNQERGPCRVSIMTFQVMARNAVFSTAIFDFCNVFVHSNGERSSCASDILSLARASDEIHNMSGSTGSEMFHIVVFGCHCGMEGHCFTSPTCIMQTHIALSAREISLAVLKKRKQDGGNNSVGSDFILDRACTTENDTSQVQ